MSDQAAPAKVHTEHNEANEAIESMREVAATLKQLGDDVAEYRRRNGALFDEVEKLTERLAEAQAQAAEGADAIEAVDGFRLGLCDEDELLKKVCGRGRA